MILKTLQLRQYRNYEMLELEADPQANLIIGANAQGKTNLLEAIYVLALSKSHRTFKDKELMTWGEDNTRIYGEVEKKYGLYRLDLSFRPKGKSAKINGLEQSRLSDFIGSLNVVMFAPEDLSIVKGSPSIRRRFLDMEISQVFPSYIHHLSQYQKILQQRNQLLKQLQVANKNEQSATLLDVWDEQLAEYGSKIIIKRQSFIYKLETWAKDIHRSITSNREDLKITYQPSFEIDDFSDESVLFKQYMLKLSQMRTQEKRRGVTLVGPHRDDLLFFINDMEVQTYGSQGQQRTTALSVKLAEIELIHEEVGEYPILLLDDVLSELDQQRQMQLIETFQHKVQTFITTTGTESIDMNRMGAARIFRVESGRIIDCL